MTQPDLERTTGNRRQTLGAMGLGLAALAVALPGADGKDRRDRKRGKKRNRCIRQPVPCRAAFAEFCAGREDPAHCEQRVETCCASLSTCNAGATMECLIGAFLVL